MEAFVQEFIRRVVEAPFLQGQFLGFDLGYWVLAVLTLLGVGMLGRILVSLLRRILTRLRGQAGADFMDQIGTPLRILGYVIGLGISLVELPFVGITDVIAGRLYLVLLIGTLFWIVLALGFIARGQDTRGVQAAIVIRGTLFVYANVALGFLLLILIQWPIWCLPNCTAVNLNNTSLIGINLSGIRFVEANLTSVDLSNADLSGADLSGAVLNDATLRGADLTGTILIGADLSRVDLRGATLRDTDFRGATLNVTNFTRSDMRRVNLQGATLNNAILVEADFRNSNLRGLVMNQADLTGSNLEGAQLKGSELSGANLSGTNLSGANLSGAYLNLADLSNADLSNATLAGAALIGARLPSVNMRGSALEGAILLGANLSGTDLSGADLRGVILFPSEFQDETVLRLDPLLSALNELQRNRVLVPVTLGGVVFDESTIWPPSKQVLLSDRLGQQGDSDGSFSSEALIALEAREPRSFHIEPPDFDEIFGGIVGVSHPSLYPLSRDIAARARAAGFNGQLVLNRADNETSINLFCIQTQADFMVITRQLTGDEIETCDPELPQTPHGTRLGTIQTLVVVVNPLNGYVNSLTLQDLQEALTLERWTDVNNAYPPQTIFRYLPEPGTDAYQLIVDVVLNGDDSSLLAQRNTLFDGNDANLVWELVSRPSGVAIIDFDYYLANQTLLRGVTLDGVPPTRAGVERNDYLLSRPVMLYFSPEWNQQNFHVSAFLAYYVEHAPERLAVRTGFQPLNGPAVDREARAFMLASSGTVR